MECEEVVDWVRCIKGKYGESLLLKAEDTTAKSRFRRLRERVMKLLVKTERLGM